MIKRIYTAMIRPIMSYACAGPGRGGSGGTSYPGPPREGGRGDNDFGAQGV